jgi:SAM-dependent methyltransferase
MTDSGKASREIAHGRMLMRDDPEYIWGWATPAGRLRARRRAALMGSAAGLGAGVRAVEIGCGTGMFTEMFAATGSEIVAVDVSEDLLARARRRNLPGDRVRLICAPIEDLRIEGLCDAAVGSSVLHHLDLDRALANIHQLLKPGGKLSFAEPNMLNPQVFLERHPGPFRRHFYYVSDDETAFVRWRLAACLERHGFSDIRITPFDWLHPRTPAWLIPMVLRTGRVAEATPGLREFAGSLHITARRAD